MENDEIICTSETPVFFDFKKLDYECNSAFEYYKESGKLPVSYPILFNKLFPDQNEKTPFRERKKKITDHFDNIIRNEV